MPNLFKGMFLMLFILGQWVLMNSMKLFIGEDLPADTGHVIDEVQVWLPYVAYSMLVIGGLMDVSLGFLIKKPTTAPPKSQPVKIQVVIQPDPNGILELPPARREYTPGSFVDGPLELDHVLSQGDRQWKLS